MSSSVFTESSIKPRTAHGSDVKEGSGEKVITTTATASASNLVVVYGKNGVNFDRKGLESLIEEKTISSISVIRLTSPTPSMKSDDEKEEHEELMRRLELSSECDSQFESEDCTGTENETEEHTAGEDSNQSLGEKAGSTDEHCDNTGEENTRKKKHKKKLSRLARIRQLKKQLKNDRPEIVGLSVEDFYPPEAAREVAKSVLKAAGVAAYKLPEDYEFQLLVINNDHCYTPFTSPEQMKLKMAADKAELEKQAALNRKVTSTPVPKLQILKQKPHEISLLSSKCQKHSDENEYIDVGEETETKLRPSGDGAQSDETDSEISADTDNDRDSDLDFNAASGNRQKKLRMKKSKTLATSKAQKPRQQQTSQEQDKLPIFRMRPLQKSGHDESHLGRITQVTVKPRAQTTITTPQKHLSAEIAALPPIPRKQHIIPVNRITQNSSQPSIGAGIVRKGPVVQLGMRLPVVGRTVQSSQGAVKEIVINKVMANPRGGFTDIGALLCDQNKQDVQPSTSSVPKTGPLPLAVGMTAKKAQPVQISLQTHQSSSELAAENDKQLDLIDSIVKDEMTKMACTIEGEESALNENIPKIVEMLESTEKALESKNAARLNQFNATNSVENIDISNAPLLENSEDDLPEDLLQHVVELMEDDKTLQEAVEKEVFGEANTETVPSATMPSLNAILGPLETQQTILQPMQTKSIIEIAISNTCNTKTTHYADSPFHMVASTPKVSPMVRKEPVQIQRGNGRVITLPPIEAPTTRARRLLQSQTNSFSTTLNDSSLDTSLISNTSLNSTDTSTTGVEQKGNEAINRSRTSKEENTLGNTSTTTTATATKPTKRTGAAKSKMSKGAASTSKSEAEASESHEDDDDPNKLWCICRQPHNNRFMICCDACEDWFHGTCVSVTKAMGTEMEKKGIDWTCPQCLKKQEEKKQRKISDMFTVKKTAKPTDNMEVKEEPQPVSSESATEAINSNIPEINEQSKVKPKIEIPAKKQVISVKRMPPGQFVALKDLQGSKKVSVTVVTRPEKKQPPTDNTITVQSKEENLTPVQKQPKVLHQQQLKVVKITSKKVIDTGNPASSCIVCKKVARPKAIYCSDECIRKHVHNALSAYTHSKSPEPVVVNNQCKSKGLFEDLLSMADRKPRTERVNVYDRRTGRVLTGNSAPTTLTIKKWLQDNPTYEILQPGSGLVTEIEKKQKQQVATPSSPVRNKPNSLATPTTSPQHAATPTQVKITPILVKKSEPPRANTESPVHKSSKQTVEQGKSSPRLQRTPQPVAVKPEKPKTDVKDDNPKPKEKPVKRQNSESGQKKSEGNDPIRLNVRRTLTDLLTQRMNEPILNDAGDIDDRSFTKLSAKEIEAFVKETEAEMYNYFNHDIGSKYKSKYRSLMFNLKDRKNRTLFTKICEKLIEPKQLVKMTPEELASQELAQWREKETKHQLEMIKKSELDLLSCAKNYVLKTHKGEEVIEGKPDDWGSVDPTVPVEDVVSVLNSSAASTSTGGILNESTSSASVRKDYSLNSTFDNERLSNSSVLDKNEGDKMKSHHKEKDKDRHRDRDRDKDRAHERDRRHKSKDRHREKFKSKKRSRSRSRSHSRSREKRHKSLHKDERRDREKDERRDKDDRYEKDEHLHNRERDRTKSHSHKEEADKKIVKKSQSDATDSSSSSLHNQKEKPKEHKSPVKKPLAVSSANSLETFNLIDKIIESTKTVEEAANIKSDKISDIPIPPTGTAIARTESNAFQADGDQEPSSTVVIATPPLDPYVRYSGTGGDAILSPNLIWAGNINMIDVASFQIILQPVTGNSFNMGRYLPDELDIVGRIGPDTVWDYISKIKKSPNKEIVVIRLVPSNESETQAYTILYQYLDKRKRLGVIKSHTPQIKDFYIFPLGSGKSLPTVLQPTETVGFYEDPYRPDILIGIVIRVIGKRVAATTPHIPQTTMASAAKHARKAADTESFTPPTSPSLKKRVQSSTSAAAEIDLDAIIKGPIATKNTKPKIPTQTEIDDANEPYSPGDSSEESMPLPPVKPTDRELKRQMDEINRQIAAQEMEIAGLLKKEPALYTEAANPPSTMLANITIPTNLSQILASIKNKSDSSTPPIATPRASFGTAIAISHTDEEYNPEDSLMNSYKATEKSTSRLAQLSEAELLSMVPDDLIDETLGSSRYEEPPPPGV